MEYANFGGKVTKNVSGKGVLMEDEATRKAIWIRMKDFFPSKEFEADFEISFDTVSRLTCPICGEGLQQVFIRAGDALIFSGWGPCRCKQK
jgi:uncharacterized protein (UPF0212 family)